MSDDHATKSRNKEKRQHTVWNETLIDALRSRAILSRQNGKRNAISLDQAANAIESVRADIYVCKNFIETSRIVNFPSKSKYITKSIEILCRKIILGTEPVHPNGYVPTNNTRPITHKPTRTTSTLSATHVGGTLPDDDDLLDVFDPISTGTPIFRNQDYMNVAIHDTFPTFPNDDRAATTNPYENDHYLKNMKRRGGAYAILVAFYHSMNKTMTKQQIIRAAQPHCDEMMEGNYHQGRMFGAWKSIDTLVTHDLVMRQGFVRYNTNAGGLRALQPDKFTLTSNGELFIDAMLQRYPDIERNNNSLSIVHSTPPKSVRSNVSSPTSSTSSRLNGVVIASTDMQEIQNELNDWAHNLQTKLGESREYKLIKAKRLKLHRICDKINEHLQQSGSNKMLRHESFGVGRNRTLHITVIQQPNHDSLHTPPPYHVIAPPNVLSQPKSVTSSNFTGGSYVLDPEATTITSGKTLPMSPKAAAAEAAFLRQALHESKMLEKKLKLQQQLRQQATVKLLSSITKSKDESSITPSSRCNMNKMVVIDDDDDRKQSAQDLFGKKRKRDVDSFDLTNDIHDAKLDPPEASVVNLTDSPNNRTESKRKKVVNQPGSDADLVKMNAKSTEINVCPVVDVDINNKISSFFIYIDNRERNRNHTPRYLRMELNRIVSDEGLGRMWPCGILKPIIEEKKIRSGDFEFYVTNTLNDQDNQLDRIPVWIERKRISDLVQRSYYKEHWMQMHRSRDEAASVSSLHYMGRNEYGGICVLLLEGNIRTANLFTPYGAQNETDSRNERSHTVDDEDCVYYFMARSIISSPTMRFYQANDEQAALRGISALAIMSVFSQITDNLNRNKRNRTLTNIRPILPQKQTRQNLQDRLVYAGVPYLLAVRVSEEIGSELHLDTIYGMADEHCRDSLLVPIISDVVHQLEKYQGTALSWSTGIHRAYYSVHDDPKIGRDKFDEVKDYVEDHGNLLAQIHQSPDTNSALNAVFDHPIPTNMAMNRVVHIHLPRAMESIFLIENHHDVNKSFYKLHPYISQESPTGVTVAMMQTACSRYQSSYIFIFLMEGTEFLNRISSIDRNLRTHGNNYALISRFIAQKIRDDCFSASTVLQPIDETRDISLLLIRGLRNSINQHKKRADYQDHTLSLVELVLADCMLHHGLVVMQAVHVMNDRERILKQVALACYHCHLLSKISAAVSS